MRIDEKKLFFLMAKKGWSYVDLAAHLGVSKPCVNTYRKSKNIRASSVYKLAQALDCSPEDLLAEE